MLKYYCHLNKQEKKGKLIFVLARNEELGLKALQKIYQTNNELQDKVQYHQLDITNVESIHHLADYIKKKHGGLDILINNAAIMFRVKIEKDIVFFSSESFMFYI